MKCLASALALLVWLAAARSPASAESPTDDPACLPDTRAETTCLPACRADMEVETTCSCEPGLLHPTQMSVGMIQVQAKVDKLERKKEKKLYAYLSNHPVPVTVGPNDALYITDYHHLAVALLNMGVQHTYCQIKDNRRDKTIESFWASMVDDKNAWPYDANGVERSRSSSRRLRFQKDQRKFRGIQVG